MNTNQKEAVKLTGVLKLSEVFGFKGRCSVHTPQSIYACNPKNTSQERPEEQAPFRINSVGGSF